MYLVNKSLFEEWYYPEPIILELFGEKIPEIDDKNTLEYALIIYNVAFDTSIILSNRVYQDYNILSIRKIFQTQMLPYKIDDINGSFEIKSKIIKSNKNQIKDLIDIADLNFTTLKQLEGNTINNHEHIFIFYYSENQYKFVEFGVSYNGISLEIYTKFIEKMNELNNI